VRLGAIEVRRSRIEHEIAPVLAQTRMPAGPNGRSAIEGSAFERDPIAAAVQHVDVVHAIDVRGHEGRSRLEGDERSIAADIGGDAILGERRQLL
jgi:hypothetical protein